MAQFQRDVTTGELTFQGCVADNDTGFVACAQDTDGLLDAIGIVVSPDGDNVYATGEGDDTVVRFAREFEDADADGVPDPSDACPGEGGPASNSGCPVSAAPVPETPLQSGLPPPVANETVNLGVVEGVVRIKLPGQSDFFVMEGPIQVPVGTIIDTTQGRVRLTSASDTSGGTRSAEFWDGLFEVGQTEGKQATELITVLELVPKVGCDGRKKGEGNGLWGDGDAGHATEGRRGSGLTTREAVWFVGDTCKKFTAAKVKEGKVSFRDFVLDKTVKLSKGDSYVAGRAGYNKKKKK